MDVYTRYMYVSIKRKKKLSKISFISIGLYNGAKYTFMKFGDDSFIVDSANPLHIDHFVYHKYQ